MAQWTALVDAPPGNRAGQYSFSTWYTTPQNFRVSEGKNRAQNWKWIPTSATSIRIWLSSVSFLDISRPLAPPTTSSIHVKAAGLGKCGAEWHLWDKAFQKWPARKCPLSPSGRNNSREIWKRQYTDGEWYVHLWWHPKSTKNRAHQIPSKSTFWSLPHLCLARASQRICPTTPATFISVGPLENKTLPMPRKKTKTLKACPLLPWTSKVFWGANQPG